jgi:spermidine/putrescine transport system permease protein
MERKKSRWSFLSNGYLVLVLLFIYLPIFYVVLFSFNESKSLTNFTGFSLRWYENMFNDETMLQSIYTTVLTAVIATVVSTVVGTVAAIGLSKAKPLVRNLILEVNNLPVMNPDIVTAIGLMLLFISTKVQLSLTTLILAHISFCIPYVILTVMPKLRQLDDNVAEAALDLGATPVQALVKVILPQIYPAIFSGALIAFSMSFDDFVISFFTAGVGINNISMYVYSMKRYNPSVNALSTLIVVVVTLILIAANVIPRIKDKKTKKEED